MVQSSGTLKIQPTTLTDLTVTRSQYDQVINTLSLSDFTVQNDYLESNINFRVGDEATISSTGYQTQTITITAPFSNVIVLAPLEFSNIETNSIKYYCKDEVARNSITSIATDLNNKAGTDLANVTDTGKILMSGMGMPSDSYIDLTLGANGSTYTAPANGWFQFAWIGAGASCQFYNDSAGSFWETKNGETQACSIQAKKGDTIIQYYIMGSASMRWFRFYYAVGSESEAS